MVKIGHVSTITHGIAWQIAQMVAVRCYIESSARGQASSFTTGIKWKVIFKAAVITEI